MAVTVAYLYPVAGSPPASPNLISNMVVATITATSAGDTSAIVTHNFNLPASDISSGFPELIHINEVSQSNPLFELSENPNFTIFGVGGVGTWKVWIERPHSIVR